MEFDKNKIKLKIAISKIKEEDIVVNKNQINIGKGIGIAACVLMTLSGAVFAGNKVIENVWKTPSKVENLTYEITEESKKENISEEQAKEIAISKLKEIGFNSNIVEIDHYKEIDSNKIMYRFLTEDNYAITIKGQTGEFYDVWNNNKNQQDCDIYITEEEAIEIANNYYKLFGYKEGEYEITKVSILNNELTKKDAGYKIDIRYNKKYGDTYNPFESICIGIESKYKNIDYFRVDNEIFDNNETIITEDEAIQIALDTDKKITTNKIIGTKAQKMVVKMNAESYKRINDIEKYYQEKQSVNSEIEYYTVDDKIRNAWVVVISYEDNYGSNIQKRYTESQYSYFIDCTTGEIIGGHVMDYIYSMSV